MTQHYIKLVLSACALLALAGCKIEVQTTNAEGVSEATASANTETPDDSMGSGLGITYRGTPGFEVASGFVMGMDGSITFGSGF